MALFNTTGLRYDSIALEIFFFIYIHYYYGPGLKRIYKCMRNVKLRIESN